MSNNLIPLYYAILKHFEDGQEHSCANVMDALAPSYGSYKLFTKKDIEEALDTAKENGLLDETRYDLDEAGQLRIFYQINDFGAEMMRKYL